MVTIDQAWELVFKPFTMKICEVIWIFTNYLWKTGFWKRDISFFSWVYVMEDNLPCPPSGRRIVGWAARQYSSPLHWAQQRWSSSQNSLLHSAGPGSDTAQNKLQTSSLRKYSTIALRHNNQMHVVVIGNTKPQYHDFRSGWVVKRWRYRTQCPLWPCPVCTLLLRGSRCPAPRHSDTARQMAVLTTRAV